MYIAGAFPSKITGKPSTVKGLGQRSRYRRCVIPNMPVMSLRSDGSRSAVLFLVAGVFRDRQREPGIETGVRQSWKRESG